MKTEGFNIGIQGVVICVLIATILPTHLSADETEEGATHERSSGEEMVIKGKGFQLNYVVVGVAVLLQVIAAIGFVYVRVFKWDK